jgi:signal peptidase I
MNKRRIGAWVLPFLGVFVFRSVLADQYVIPSGSMEPTIQVGDHVLVAKMAYDLRVPFTKVSLAHVSEARRGDVVVFHDPRDEGRFLIKRLMGLPGDRMRVKDGQVAVNGRWLELEPVDADGETQTLRETADAGIHLVQRLPGRWRASPAHGGVAADREFRVPPGHYFFMGDNRDNSSDSRDWGFVPRHLLAGRALGVLYSVRWDGWVPSVSLARAGTRL